MQPAKWYRWLRMSHHNWWTRFDSQSGHTKDLKIGTYDLFSLLRSIDGWMQRNGSCAMLPLTHHQRTIQWKKLHGPCCKQVKMGNAGHVWHS